MASLEGSNGNGDELRQTTVGAGSADRFRIEFTPTSADQRFGVFQLYVCGVPLGDGTTTALYPHFVDLQRLASLVERPGVKTHERLVLGDTFDHLDLYLEIFDADVVFSFATRPEWGLPPSWAADPGAWTRLSITRADIIRAWQLAKPDFQRLIQRT